MEKAQGFASIHDNGVENTKTKQLEKIGIKPRTAERFETLARHPQAVERAKADARAEGRIVTRQAAEIMKINTRVAKMRLTTILPKHQKPKLSEIKKNDL